MATKFFVEICIGAQTICTIESDNPDFSPIAKYLVENTKADLTKLEIKCDDEQFDKDSLRVAIIDSFKDFQSAVEMDEQELQHLIGDANETKA